MGINGNLLTPPLNSARLDGVTRDSILALAKEMGFPMEERRIKLEELEKGFKNGTISEAFGAGTAAVVAPIQSIRIHGVDYTVPLPDGHSFQLKIKKQLMDIRTGAAPDKHQWNYIIKIK